jgi:hypothetical protein
VASLIESTEEPQVKVGFDRTHENQLRATCSVNTDASE